MATTPVPKLPRLPRKDTRIFADTSQRIPKFGSLANGNGEFNRDLNEIQDLPAFLTGWYGAIVDNNAPTIEDMDALFHALFRQVAYFAQAGIPEYSSTMTYYANSIVRFNELVYTCYNDIPPPPAGSTTAPPAGLVGINPDDSTRWRRFANSTTQKVTTATYDLRRNTDDDVILVDTSTAAVRLNLPPPLRGWKCTIKDIGFKASQNRITIARPTGINPVPKIENNAADFIADSDGGVWDIVCDGTDYFIISIPFNRVVTLETKVTSLESKVTALESALKTTITSLKSVIEYINKDVTGLVASDNPTTVYGQINKAVDLTTSQAVVKPVKKVVISDPPTLT